MIPIVPKSLDLNEQILYKLAVDVCGKRLNRFAGLFIKTLCPFNPRFHSKEANLSVMLKAGIKILNLVNDYQDKGDSKPSPSEEGAVLKENSSTAARTAKLLPLALWTAHCSCCWFTDDK